MQIRGLEENLQDAQKAIEALTPLPGRGKRQINTESDLQSAIAAIEKQYRIEGLLEVIYNRECRLETRYGGRGRGSAQREQHAVEPIRYQITAVVRNEPAILSAQQRLGWRAYVTIAPQVRLSLEAAVLCYRNQYRIEDIYKRINI